MIDKEEFKKVMALMRAHNRQGAVHRDGRRFRFKAVDPVENGGLLEHFFGKDGKTKLQHEKFFQFMKSLHEEVCSPFPYLYHIWISMSNDNSRRIH